MPIANDTDKMLTFIQSLDLHLALGKPPARALAEAAEDFAFVYHPSTGSGQHEKDGRRPNDRREERMKEHGKGGKGGS